jgi:quinoprotein glucose dehydrogenase
MGVATTPLIELVRNEQNPPTLRAAAVAAMAETKDAQLADAAAVALAAKDPAVRVAAIRVQPAVPGGAKVLADVLAGGTPREQQAAVQTAAAAVAANKDPDKSAERVLKARSTAWKRGRSRRKRTSTCWRPRPRRRPATWPTRTRRTTRPGSSRRRPTRWPFHRDTLAGGDAERGAYVFRERADASCLRCHAINKVGGNAGPDLAGLAARYAPAGGGGQWWSDRRRRGRPQWRSARRPRVHP